MSTPQTPKTGEKHDDGRPERRERHDADLGALSEPPGHSVHGPGCGCGSAKTQQGGESGSRDRDSRT